jgi:hypothetical protein
MKRALGVLLPVVVLLFGSAQLRAASAPVIQGDVFGVELCPQSVCGAAIFVAVFHGQIGGNPNAVATVAVAVTHDDLPDPGQFAAITGGVWELKTIWRRFRGLVVPFAMGLFNNGNNTYTVRAPLVLVGGGAGVLSFEGLLDHNVFPPTIRGRLSQ